MTTGLTDRLQRIYGKYHKGFSPETYTETFEEFCESICATDLLMEGERYIIHKLIKQWEMNKRRGK